MRRTLLAVLLLIPLRLLAQPDTRLLSSPTVSRDHVAFLYAGDLWISDLDGRNVRRLTSDPGIERNPAFSPDGRTIAYSAQYDAASPAYGIEAARRRSSPSRPPAASRPGCRSRTATWRACRPTAPASPTCPCSTTPTSGRTIAAAATRGSGS